MVSSLSLPRKAELSSYLFPPPVENVHHDQVTVVVVPLPAQGHLNQLLQLSCLIATYNIQVHYVGSTTHIRQAKHRLHGWVDPKTTSMIRFHDFPIISISPTDQTEPNTNTNSNHQLPTSTTGFPAHFLPVFEASAQLQLPVSQLLQTLSSQFKRVIVVHDSLMASVVQDVRSIPNGESYAFHSVSAFALFFYIWEATGKPVLKLEDGMDIPRDIPSNEGCFTSDFTNFMVNQHKFLSQSSGRLYNTSRSLEDPYINLLLKLPLNAKKKLFAIGPLNPVAAGGKNSSKNRATQTKSVVRHRCLEWLDKQAKKSVLYVSFGTMASMTSEEIRELAIGLEQSQLKFLWVLREADRGDVFKLQLQQQGGGDERGDLLPKGYEERVKGRGIVIKDWAPQLEVLGHPSTGGFLSHCGWNSCMESLSMGVPIAAWPMHSDQPKNAALVTQVLRAGLIVKDWGRRNKIVTAHAVQNSIRKLMDSEEGEEIRKRAEELGSRLRDSVCPGGTSRLEMNSFIAHITR